MSGPAAKRFRPKNASQASQTAPSQAASASQPASQNAGGATTPGAGDPMQRVNTGSSGGIRSAGSTPGPSAAAGPSAVRPVPRPGAPGGSGGGTASAPGLTRAPTFQKFRPKVSTATAVKAEPRVKTEPGVAIPYASASFGSTSTPYASAPAPAARGGGQARGAPRGRGATRGGRGGRGAYESVASGVFATARTRTIYRPSRRGGGITAGVADLEDEGEVYSDDEGGPGGNVIDMGAISTQGESAPTALIRAGRETGKAKADSMDQKDKKAKEKAKKRKDKGKERATTVTSTTASDGMVVKPEPISPEKRDMALAPDNDGGVDVDMDGSATPEQAVEVGDPDQGVDLSESEDEEEEETMEGDFVQAEGMEEPSSKIYMFQFPNLFPRYSDPRAATAIKVEDKPDAENDKSETLNTVARDGSVVKPEAGASAPDGADANADVKPDIKPDVKPNVAAKAAQQKAMVRGPMEGQVGKLVVMKSGKVKMIMGDDIVMNVAPGVPSTFLQHLVHLDPKAKSLKVMGDINKHFTVQPDIDRLLHQLWLNDGVTPNDVRKQTFDRQADGLEKKRAMVNSDNALNIDELNAEYFGGS